MSRGRATDPQKAEEVRAIAVKTANMAEASRQADIPYTTAVDICKTDDEFVEFRTQAFKRYVMTTWGNIEAIGTALTKYITEGKLKEHNLLDFTRALKDLRQTVENVVNSIHIGDNIQNNYDNSPETLISEAKELLEANGYKIT